MALRVNITATAVVTLTPIGAVASQAAHGGWYLGEDKGLRITVYQDDGTTLQDITGWALSWLLKRSKTDADAAAVIPAKTVGAGIALTTPASGLCTVSITDTETDALTAGTYYHELKRTDPGNEAVLVTGEATLLQGVHRA